MGFKELLGRGPMSEKKIEKVSKLATNPFAQPDVRMREMHRLLAERTHPAFRGALKRFGVNANGHIADEEEKRWLEDAVVEVGKPIGEPLRAYIRENKTLTYALSAYERIFGVDESIRFCLEVLEHHGPESYRNSEAKLQLVHTLAEHRGDPRVLPGLLPFLEDHSDEVRWAVIDLVEAAADGGELDRQDQAAVCEVMGRIVREDGTGPRIQRRVAELLKERAWPIPDDEGEICPLLDETYFVDKKGFVRLRS